MKGAHKRFLDRQKLKTNNTNARIDYSYTDRYLERLFGNIRLSENTDERKANLKVGNSYAITCEDNDNYYRVVFLKKNPFTGSVQPLISNPTYGVIPEGIQEVSMQELFRFINFNKNLQNANKAFSYTGNQASVENFKKWSSSHPTPAEQEVMNIDNTAGIDESV